MQTEGVTSSYVCSYVAPFKNGEMVEPDLPVGFLFEYMYHSYTYVRGKV